MSEESNQLIQEVSGVLAELGQTPEAVANCLRAGGVQGVRNAARYLNPIVRLVLDKTNLNSFVVDLIQRDRLRIRLAGGEQVVVLLPPPVQRFIADFDNRKCPYLELPPDGWLFSPP
jgi:hypothetical protein